MAKAKSSDKVVVEEVAEEVVAVEEVVVEETPHSNPILRMAIEQAKQRFLRETAN